MHQVYWTVADTAAWEATLAAADTTVVEGNYRKFRSGKIWYEYVLDGEEVRSEQHYPGFERKIDSIETDRVVIYSRKWERMLVDAPMADVALGKDTVRIGVLHSAEKAFPWQRFDVDPADYLMLNPPWQDSIPIALGQDNVGPITGRTIFRVGRNHYVLRSLSDDRREMVIEPAAGIRDLPITASLDLAHRKISVNTLSGEPFQLKSRPGKELIVFFSSTHTGSDVILHRLDSAYHSMPPSARENIDMAVILKYTLPELAGPMLDTLDVDLPVYLENDKTCLRLNCRPYLPYYLEVDARGRYRTFWGRPDELAPKFAKMAPNT